MLSFVQKTILILRKSTKLCANTADLLVQDAPNHLYAAGFVPFPLTTPPRPAAGSGQRSGKERRREGRKGMEKGKRMEVVEGEPPVFSKHFDAFVTL